MYLPTKFDFLQQLLVYTHALYCIRPRLLIFASSLIYVLAGKDHRVLGGRKRILGTGDWGSTALSIGGCELWSSMNHTLEQISLRREHNPRRTGKGGCEKRGPWSWPNNHSLFSVAMRFLSGLQLSPAFLSSSHSHCPCTCCSITCQPTKTQRLWIICQCLNCWNCVSPGHFFSHIFTPCLCSLLLSGTEVSCRRHSHGALLCSRVGKVLCCCFVVCPTDYYCICSPSQDNI